VLRRKGKRAPQRSVSTSGKNLKKTHFAEGVREGEKQFGLGKGGKKGGRDCSLARRKKGSNVRSFTESHGGFGCHEGAGRKRELGGGRKPFEKFKGGNKKHSLSLQPAIKE